MSLFQCEECGCVENTALSCQGFKGFASEFFSWEGIESRKGKMLCSACGPRFYSDGKESGEFGEWHDVFPRKYLPIGMFKTNKKGDLEHKIIGETDYTKYFIK